MRILVVAATAGEIASLASALGVRPSGGHLAAGTSGRHQVDVLVTGVGMVATAVHCARAFARQPYDLALNFGVCGSFAPGLPVGTAVHVTTEQLSELGAEDGDAFLSIDDLQLACANQFPLEGGRLINARPPALAMLSELPRADGITVNTVHGRDSSIASLVARLHPDVESMEGAAFMYASLVAGVSFAEVRAVSNVVERRNRSAWKLDAAIERLNVVALRLLDQA